MYAMELLISTNGYVQILRNTGPESSNSILDLYSKQLQEFVDFLLMALKSHSTYCKDYPMIGDFVAFMLFLVVHVLRTGLKATTRSKYPKNLLDYQSSRKHGFHSYWN